MAERESILAVEPHQLETLRARRARELERRRRRRRRRVSTLAMLAAAAVAVSVALSTASSGGSVHRHTQHWRPRPEAVRYPGTVAPGGLQSQLAAVERLAAHGLPLFCGGRAKRMVALTFDDGPGVYTTLALKKLREYHVHATFFLVGKEIRAFPGLARRERRYAAFGDHTMTHPFLPALSRAAMVQEIAGARRLIESTVREPVDLFRPPYEGRTPAIDSEVRSLGMLEVLWNVDSQDSLGASYAGIERIVRAGLRPGSIILMHENHGQTIRALPVIFAALRRDRLQPVTIPQLVADDPPTLAQLRAGSGGCSVSLRTGNGA